MITGSGKNGVCLLGEAWGAAEARHRTPFKGQAGAQLGRMIAMAGWERDDFLITNCCSFQPPGNREPTPVEIELWRPSWVKAITDHPIKVVVPLGNTALGAVLDLDGIQDKRGYLYWGERINKWVLPTIHPSFIMRGNMNWTAVWIRDVEMALKVARGETPTPIRRHFVLEQALANQDDDIPF